MKYREIYDVLEKQQIDVPGFRFSDYSGWRSPWQSYMTLHRPLWIVAKTLHQAGVSGSHRMEGI